MPNACQFHSEIAGKDVEGKGTLDQGRHGEKYTARKEQGLLG